MVAPRYSAVEECTACQRIVSQTRMILSPSGWFICRDADSCMAAWGAEQAMLILKARQK